MKQCEICGYEGEDVFEYPTWDKVLNRTTTQYQCKNIRQCNVREYNNRDLYELWFRKEKADLEAMRSLRIRGQKGVSGNARA